MLVLWLRKSKGLARELNYATPVGKADLYFSRHHGEEPKP